MEAQEERMMGVVGGGFALCDFPCGPSSPPTNGTNSRTTPPPSTFSISDAPVAVEGEGLAVHPAALLLLLAFPVLRLGRRRRHRALERVANRHLARPGLDAVARGGRVVDGARLEAVLQQEQLLLVCMCMRGMGWGWLERGVREAARLCICKDETTTDRPAPRRGAQWAPPGRPATAAGAGMTPPPCCCSVWGLWGRAM